jgi:NAD(P)-dependent dehydrogenase (short-subunit alcohol dehydrogenase family)
VSAKEIFDVAGQNAIVTGAGSGLGSAFATVLAENGARVSLLDIDLPSAKRLSADLNRRGFDTAAVELDVADVEAQTEAIDRISGEHGSLEIVFLNAGISAGPGPFREAGKIENLDLTAWQKVIQTNLTSCTFGIKAAAKHMKRRGYGRIVVTSSIACFAGDSKVGYAYVGSKAGIANVVRQAALEMAPHGISVNAIAPGPFMTNIGGGRLHDPETAEAFRAEIPMGRIANTSEIKGLALLLGSKAASYLTGQVVAIDGGIMAG